MITVNRYGGHVANNTPDLVGISTDVTDLPIEEIKNGTVFYAMDTLQVYMFDEENKVWILQES